MVAAEGKGAITRPSELKLVVGLNGKNDIGEGIWIGANATGLDTNEPKGGADERYAACRGRVSSC